MSFEVFFQLAVLTFIVISGPLIVVLIATQEGNGL